MKTSIPLLVLAAALLPTAALSAATRASTDYSLTTETTDAGGGRTASAAYLNDGTLGGLGGLSTAATPPEMAKHGYVGQLYDLSSLALSATPPTVNEGSTRPVYATAMMDDATSLQLPGPSVAWSIVSGPLGGMNANGLATANIVYQNSAAVVRGDYQAKFGTLGLTVLDVNNDNFGLYAGDGVPDGWQVANFGPNNPLGLAGMDPDLDGQTNAFEYVVGTIPTDSNSRFRLRIEDVPGRPTQKNLIFSPRYPDRAYTALWRLDVAAGSFAAVPTTSTTDNGLERTVTDLDATNATRFYRVQITLPP